MFRVAIWERALGVGAVAEGNLEALGAGIRRTEGGRIPRAPPGTGILPDITHRWF